MNVILKIKKRKLKKKIKNLRLFPIKFPILKINHLLKEIGRTKLFDCKFNDYVKKYSICGKKIKRNDLTVLFI